MARNCSSVRAAGMSALLWLAALAAGCATSPAPAEFTRLGPEAAASREMQTRRVRGIGETELLMAAVGVLQDQGFRITASEAQLGVVIGTKPRSLEDMLAEIGHKSLLAGVTFGLHPDVQHGPSDEFGVVVTTRPASGEAGVQLVRVTFSVHGHVMAAPGKRMSGWAEVLHGPMLYQEFFRLLDQALLRGKQER